ncbi:metallophosphoesterase [Cryomorphaceae bacterium 1068]|nr:metallophosphoesterase [Cryomorphaceae bacterium 1068]
MNRRKFLKRSAIGAVGVGFLGGMYTWQVEPFWLEFVKVRMPITNLPDQLVGKTLLQISDIHVGNRFDYNYLIDSFKKAQAMSPDYVVYTGDYVSYENEEQFTQLKTVMEHAVRGSTGTFGVLGNHDYGEKWSEQPVANEITAIMEGAGVEILSNDQAKVGGLNIIGFDDYWSLNFAPYEVMNQYDSSKANIVLCHNPDVCDLDVWKDHQGWILSGHTHGGQCKPPFLDPPIIPVRNDRYTAGEIDLHDGRRLYINRALGHLRQVRFNVRPEITIFELQQA